jgi:phage-related protein
MDASLEKDVPKLDFNEEEITQNHRIVSVNLNQYVANKHPELKDGQIVERS